MSTLSSRIRRWFLSEANAKVDRIENPAHMLDQALREMAHKGKKLNAAKSHLTRQIERLKERLGDCQVEHAQAKDNASRFLALQDEPKVKAYLRQQLTSEKAIQGLARQIDAMEQQLSKVQERLAQHFAQFQAYKAERITLMARYQCAQTSGMPDLDEYQETCEELVERMRERIELAEAHSSVYDVGTEWSGHDSVDLDVEAALVALKQQNMEAQHV